MSLFAVSNKLKYGALVICLLLINGCTNTPTATPLPALHLAIIQGNAAQVEKLLAAGIDANTPHQTYSGNNAISITPLEYAFQANLGDTDSRNRIILLLEKYNANFTDVTPSQLISITDNHQLLNQIVIASKLHSDDKQTLLTQTLQQLIKDKELSTTEIQKRVNNLIAVGLNIDAIKGIEKKYLPPQAIHSPTHSEDKGDRSDLSEQQLKKQLITAKLKQRIIQLKNTKPIIYSAYDAKMTEYSQQLEEQKKTLEKRIYQNNKSPSTTTIANYQSHIAALENQYQQKALAFSNSPKARELEQQSQELAREKRKQINQDIINLEEKILCIQNSRQSDINHCDANTDEQ